MKNLFILFACLSVALYGCSKTEQSDPPPATKGNLIEYTLNISGEDLPSNFEVIEQSTRAIPEQFLLGIQIETKSPSAITYSYYGWGVFDRLDDIKILLYDNQEYIIYAALYDKTDYNGYNFYNIPGHTNTNNIINYSNSIGLIGLNTYLTYYYGSSSHDYPNIQVYYAYKEFASSDEQEINLDMKFISAKTDYHVKGLVDGYLVVKWSYSTADRGWLQIDSEGNSDIILSRYLAFYHAKSIYDNDAYSQQVPFYINWHREDGRTINVAQNSKVTMSPKKHYIINIVLNEPDNNNSPVGFTCEDFELEAGGEHTFEYNP